MAVVYFIYLLLSLFFNSKKLSKLSSTYVKLSLQWESSFHGPPDQPVSSDVGHGLS